MHLLEFVGANIFSKFWSRLDKFDLWQKVNYII